MVVQRMLKMGSTITEADITAVLINFEKAVKDICLEGNKITMEGFVQFTPALSGTFQSELDGFDPARHNVYVTSQISAAYNNDFERDATMEKITSTERKPNLIGVIDVKSGDNNKTVTKGQIVTVAGENLKFDPASQEESLRFVNGADVTVSTPITLFQKLTDREMVFLMPDVPYATGYFEVASKMGTLTIKTGRSQTVNVV
jgi:hypothetical protein